LNQTKKPPRRIFAAVAIGAALIPLNSTMVAVALPNMGEALQADPGTLTLWLVTSYLLVNVVLQSPAGRMADILGKRRTFTLGQSIFGLGALIAVLAPRLETVALARVLMAMGGALIVPTAMALLRNVVSEDLRPRAFSYFGSLLGASAAIGPLIGGVLTQHFGWKAIFLVNVPLLLLSQILVRSENPGWGDDGRTRSPSSRFDFVGMALLATGLATGVIAAKSGGSSAQILVPLSVGSFILLGWWERRVSSPLIDPALLRKLPFLLGGTIVGLQNLAMYALLFQLPFLLRQSTNLQAGEIGRVLLSMTIGMVLFAPVGGYLAERLGTRSTIRTGLTASLLGLLGLLYSAGGETLWPLIVALGFTGAGIGIVTGPSQAAALSRIDSSQSGAGAGILSTMRYMGGIAGITIVSVVLANTDTTPILDRSQVCFWIYVAVHVVALAITPGLPSRRVSETVRAQSGS